MAWKPNLTASEILEMQMAGYMVRSHWIMPGGYYEHYLIRLGGLSGRDEIKTTMSPRACYTYFKRHLTKRSPDAGDSVASTSILQASALSASEGDI